MELLTDRHIKYFRRNLTLFPAHFTSYDSNLTSLAYFCVSGLALLGRIEEIKSQELVDWVYSNLVEDGSGFRGSINHKIGGEFRELYDPANLASTFFCVSMLAMLEDRDMPRRLDKIKMLNYIKRCQREDGMFAGVFDGSNPFGDHDFRYTYVALCLIRLLGEQPRDWVNVGAIVRAIVATQRYDGGLGDGESHSGLTYCGVSVLKLLDCLDDLDVPSLTKWLSQRQQFGDGCSGGFNGRCNKLEDTCYSFWTQGSLAQLGLLELTNFEKNRDYLLEKTQNPTMGGFGKMEGEYPDPMHSHLALASLALQNEPALQAINATFCLPVFAFEFIKSINWSI
ncbi:geranylgeranyl transferase type-2 subunit beta [Trichomonascus vanleenenianus]|uniref:protein geranylgeranyltransferase type I subunit CDC43 n=1 Tax=Trichomonascus vanleenenianus TaxID=2268995 RepID=UPI003ECAC7AF